MDLTKEERAKIAAIKRGAAEKKRQEQIKAFKRKQEKPTVKNPVIGRFTAKDFFLFRYMATPEIVSALFILYIVALVIGLFLTGSMYPWYMRVGLALVSALVVRLLLELAVVPFSINNHLAEISDKMGGVKANGRREHMGGRQ